MNAIRNATYLDAPKIKILLESLGYRSRLSELMLQLETMFDKENHRVFVYELRKEVVGFISIHYIPQLAVDGELALISYLGIDDNWQDQGIGKALETHITEVAKERKCGRIEVHCLEWRSREDMFYKQQGYQEYPKYYTKSLVYAE
jgi:GNAT superfamily N-acetyltransferase